MRVRIKDISKVITRGISPKYSDESNFRVINQKCIRDGKVNLSLARNYNLSQKVNSDRLVRVNDVLVNSTGTGTLGRTAFVTYEENGLTVDSHVTIVRPNTDLVNPIYIAFYLRSIELIIENLATGSTGQTELSKKDLGNLELLLIDRDSQDKVAEILLVYNNLIENNTKRITILEQMAEQIYKEWFVRMRFPGYENTKFSKGNPEGWEIKSLGELCYFNHNSLKKSNTPEKIRYVDISSVSTNSIDNFEEMNSSNAPSRAKRIVHHGDIIWSSVRPINRAYARIINPVENLIVSTGFVVITPREIPSEFIYYFTTSDAFVDHIASVAKGAAYPAASVDDFKKMLLVVPSPEILNRYTKIITPILSQIDILMNQSILLKESRNLLLPRLISGKLSVQKTEKTLQDAL